MIRRAAANGKALSEGGVLDRAEPLTARYAALWQSVRGLCEATPLCLGVTACERGQGVSTVAANLAVIAAHSGWARVVLVEAAADSPSLARTFRRASSPGLAELMRGDAELADCLQETAVDRLSFIAAGDRAYQFDPGDRELTPLLKSLESEFAVVICDLPLASQPATPLWAARLDGTLLVIESGQVAAEAARQAAANLSHAGARLLGVVLTKCEHIPTAGRSLPD